MHLGRSLLSNKSLSSQPQARGLHRLDHDSAKNDLDKTGLKSHKRLVISGFHGLGTLDQLWE